MKNAPDFYFITGEHPPEQVFYCFTCSFMFGRAVYPPLTCKPWIFRSKIYIHFLPSVPSKRVAKADNAAIHFLTFTVNNWYSLFDRHNRFDILLDSLRHCQLQKGLQVFAWVFMLNHLHLIVAAPDVSGFIRDFKKFTAHQLMRNILSTEPNIAHLFTDSSGKYTVWEKTNMPVIIATDKIFAQKNNYIEHNPIRKGLVSEPSHWRYSSASPERLLPLVDIQSIE